MALTEIIEAVGKVVEKTVEVTKKVEEAGEGISKLSEVGDTLKKLSEVQTDYLSELNLEDKVWDSLSPEQCKGHLSLIETRFKEIGVTPTSQCIEGIFDDRLKQALKDSNICKDLESEKRGLTLEEREALKEETGWSNEIVENIDSLEEARIYQDAGLVEMDINGKKALIQPDIDWDLEVGPNGETNRMLVEKGYVPRTIDGQPIELHHIGQHPDSPLAELTMQQHRGKINDAILHDKLKESEIDRAAFAKERADHWRSRINAE